MHQIKKISLFRFCQREIHLFWSGRKMSGVHGENASVLDCGSKGDAGEFLFHQIRPAEKPSVIFRTLIRPSAFSVSGNLIFRNCTVGTVTAETVSGEVQIGMRNADAKLKVNTVSGNVSLLVPEGMQPSVRFSSVSGDMVHSIDCTVSENAAFSVDTVSGDLQIVAEKYE